MPSLVLTHILPPDPDPDSLHPAQYFFPTGIKGDLNWAEPGVDSVRLGEDASAVRREVAQLTTQLAKAHAKLEIARGTSCSAWLPWGGMFAH